MMVQECIMIAIRESIPTESIIRAYMDEAVEQEDEVIIEDVHQAPSEATTTETPQVTTNAQTGGSNPQKMKTKNLKWVLKI